jgi:hypothetical protein
MKYLVKIGKLGFEQGIFKRGDVVELTVERAAQMDPNDIQLIPENIENLPEPVIEVSNKKRVGKASVITATAETTPIVEEAPKPNA